MMTTASGGQTHVVFVRFDPLLQNLLKLVNEYQQLEKELAAICNNIGEFLGTYNQVKITKATSRHHFQNSTSRYRRQYRLGSLSGCNYRYW